jgi:hypothetical protein
MLDRPPAVSPRPRATPRAAGAAALRIISCAAAAALFPVAASSQASAAGNGGGAGPVPHADAPVALALAITEPIRIDGRLDEAAWARAVPVTGFTQVTPDEGEPATERTEVRILYDHDAIYVGARMYDSQAPTARLGRRDTWPTSDWLTVIFDSYHDHRTAYGFEVNPAGVRRDQTRDGGREDDSWDPVWEVATAVDEEGWTAEMRIPFSQLRFNAADEQVWGLQIERQLSRRGEFSTFSFTPSTHPGGIPRYGHLHGLRDLRTGRRTEILPYVVARAESVDRSANPFRENRDARATGGLDLKHRLTSDLTLDATVNPDFGQVEVDPAQVNLTAIETRFQERRPFFVEGAEIFNFGSGGGNSVFYSRRIGRRPQLGLSTAADVADAARILGAAKLSGRTGGGWSVGFLNATTERVEAVFRGPEEDVSTTAEPFTNYMTGRLRRDSRAGRTVLGGMVTAVNRDLDTEVMRGFLPSAAYTGGVDFRHQSAERTWSLTGFVSGSHVRGAPEAMLRRQRAPWRYYQRPDAPHLSLDPEATSLTGVASEANLSYRSGRHWRVNAVLGTITPGYEVNDLGFQARADRIDTQAGVTYIENRPGRTFRQWNVGGSYRNEWNYAGDPVQRTVFLNSWWQGLNYWTYQLNFGATLPSMDDRLTRGGPLARRPSNWRVFTSAGSDGRRPVSASAATYYERRQAGGWVHDVYTNLSLRPTPWAAVVVGPTLSRSHSAAQYLGAVTDTTAAHTFGARYLFAELRQNVVSFDTRVNVTFTPALSLQMYAQPFVAAADFGALAELAAPRSYDFLVYGRDVGEVRPREEGGIYVYPRGVEAGHRFTYVDPDFNARSLRGNAVLRWEWRPGSTLYLAWQQQRSDQVPIGDFDFGRDTRALWRTRPDNVLMLKVNYWLNP